MGLARRGAARSPDVQCSQSGTRSKRRRQDPFGISQATMYFPSKVDLQVAGIAWSLVRQMISVLCRAARNCSFQSANRLYVSQHFIHGRSLLIRQGIVLRVGDGIENLVTPQTSRSRPFIPHVATSPARPVMSALSKTCCGRLPSVCSIEHGHVRLPTEAAAAAAAAAAIAIVIATLLDGDHERSDTGVPAASRDHGFMLVNAALTATCPCPRSNLRT
jgi:hypothetical protein